MATKTPRQVDIKPDTTQAQAFHPNSANTTQKNNTKQFAPTCPNKGACAPQLRLTTVESIYTTTTLEQITYLARDVGVAQNYVSTENMLPNFKGVSFTAEDTPHFGLLYERGDILISNIRPYLKKIWLADVDGCCSTDVLVLRTKGKHILHQRFLYHVLASNWFVDYVMQSVKGSKMPRGDKHHIMQVPILLPSIAEQKRIGSLFKELDRNLALNRTLLDKLTKLKASLLEQMFPRVGESVPQLRFEGFSEPWEQRCLKELVVSFDYGLNAPAKSFDFTTKYLRVKDIDEDSRSFSTAGITTPDIDKDSADKYLAHENDLFFGRAGSIGRTYLHTQNTGRVVFATNFIRAHLKQEQFSPEFVFYNTLTQGFLDFVQATSTRSVQPSINAQLYGSYLLMIPSLAEQQHIGAFFKAMDERIAQQRAKLNKLEQLKQALLEQMFVSAPV